MSVTSFSLVIPGEPRGQKRARHGKGFTYTDDDQEAYAATIHGEWIAAGRPMLPEGPYRVDVMARMSRPKGHFRKDGTLSTAGLALPYPTKRPDVDNFLKQVDALVAVGALPDDAAMVEAAVNKRWATTNRTPGLTFVAISLVPPPPESAA